MSQYLLRLPCGGSFSEMSYALNFLSQFDTEYDFFPIIHEQISSRKYSTFLFKFSKASQHRFSFEAHRLQIKVFYIFILLQLLSFCCLNYLFFERSSPEFILLWLILVLEFSLTRVWIFQRFCWALPQGNLVLMINQIPSC